MSVLHFATFGVPQAYLIIMSAWKLIKNRLVGPLPDPLICDLQGRDLAKFSGGMLQLLLVIPGCLGCSRGFELWL